MSQVTSFRAAMAVGAAYKASQPRFRSATPQAVDIDALVASTETRAFQTKLGAEVSAAKAFIQQCLTKGEKGFVVLDVDETSVDNRDYYRDPQKRFYKHPTEGFYNTWDVWIEEGRAPALPATRGLIEWMNRKGIPYVFVTGRIQNQHAATWRNLQTAGVIGKSCRGLYCKPNEWWIGTTESHKKDIVAGLEKKLGLKALASIGDSDADMMLAEPSRNFKLSSSAFYPPRRS